MHDIHKMPGHLARRLHQISVAIFAEHMRRAGFDLTPVQFAAHPPPPQRPAWIRRNWHAKLPMTRSQ